MGELRFSVPVDWQLDPYHANSIHVVGLDGIPWPCRIETKEDPEHPRSRKLISVIRNRSESGRLYVVYDFEARGEQLVCTGTLPVREQAYDLIVEIARGSLNRLRNQISTWHEGGLKIADNVDLLINEATTLLGDAILTDDIAESDKSARTSIEKSMDAIFLLAETFADQISKVRREHPDLPNFWLANNLGSDNQFDLSAQHDAFDLVQVKIPPYGGQEPTKEMVEGLNKRAIIGPWLDASLGGMSEDLINVDDFLARKDQLIIECRQMMRNLPNTASLIHVVSGLNGTGHRHLSYPQQLQVTVDLLKLIDDSPIEVPTMVSFDFPWAERLAGAVGGVHPLQIADSLLRQGLSISFLGLDINLDYWPNGSAIRDPLQWVDLVDIWAQLGMPMIICLRCPFQDSDDDQVRPDTGTGNQTRSNVSDQQRMDFLGTVLPMLVARPSVHGLIMRQWQDQDDTRFPFAGFANRNGAQKQPYALIQKVKAAATGCE